MQPTSFRERLGFLALVLLAISIPAHGLRDPAAWFFASLSVWLLAFAGPPPRIDKNALPWVIWLGWGLLASIFGIQPWKSVYGFCRWLTVIVFFVIAVDRWTHEYEARWVYALGLVCWTLGLGSLLLPGAKYAGTNIVIHPMTGLIPPYYNYSVFVQAAFFGAGMAWFARARNPKGKAAGFIGLSMAFALFLIVRSRSRGGLLAISAAGLALLLRSERKKAFLILSAVVIGAFLLPQEMFDRVLKLDMLDHFKRPQIWKSALAMIWDHPFLGVGFENFHPYFLRHNFPTEWAVRYPYHSIRPENEALGIACETGAVGLALFILALACSWRLSGPASYACVAMAAQCLVDSMFQLPALAMLFLSGLAFGKPRTASGLRPSPKAWQSFCLIGALLSAGSFLPQRLSQSWIGEGTVHSLELATRLLPADPDIRSDLAMAYLNQAPPNGKRALLDLGKAEALSPTNALYPAMQAEILTKEGSPGEALQNINRALYLEPNFVNARLLRAWLWARAGKRTAAQKELSEALRRSNPSYLPLGGYARTIVDVDPRLLASVRRQIAIKSFPSR